ncbi:hypothetical protein [Hymenobacter negativus]|uniref:Tetratricopeptide repeat protein n=1 Tax=Hymenobacter negativus TaxID=2795026 RepID=A0ABS0Q3J4_9BACT|nr:hypothetical protein [Hymenobacter negativus]MBH8557226.1 hypothetical protein [Hymenobacter negativus]
MTRATLLHVLDRPTALGPAEVRELEQLAQAFPYCQTAHLLLAKAAHDQGTMLASQRLRRAATYAADRSLLRRLIEQVEAEPVALPVSGAAPSIESPPPVAIEPAFVAEATPVATPQPAAPVAAEIPAPAPAAVVIAAKPEPITAVEEPQPVATSPAMPAVSVEIEQALPSAVAAQLSVAPAAIAEVLSEAVPPAESTQATAIVQEEKPAVPQAAHEASPPFPVELEPATPTAAPPPIELVDQEGVEITTSPLAEPVAAVEVPEIISAPLIDAPEAIAIADELPAQAPAIRPPVEVGEARFEFGLADAPPAAVTSYELPGLVDEWAASAVTRSLGSPDAFTLPATAPAAPVFTPAAFTGDAVVGYAFGESSRLGLSMQLLDLLTAKAEAAETATAVVAAAQPPAVPLPPTGTFFEPDPLLLDHWATHCPAPPELPSTIDLINNFLKRQPRLTRPGMLPPTPGGQPDLSVRSTRSEPDLVSENLARIFVRQGKTARAIEIYEKLMVKQPEKMAYFAAQIESLQPSA